MSIYVPWLADAARTTGYPVAEVSGWRTRGHGGMRVVEGVVGHHTATPASAPGDYPSLGIVTNGRSDLPGPLCNLGLGRSGMIYVVAAGCAWHAGASAWGGFYDLNDEFLGIEAESPGDGSWTPAQRDAYPKLVGALLRYMNRGTDRYAGHKDVCLPAGRKIDPVGVDASWLRTRAAAFIAGDPVPPASTPHPEESMAQGKAGSGQISIPVNGARQLFCLVGGKGSSVDGHLYYIGDTPPGTGGNYKGDREVNFDADRPGPVSLPEGVRGVTFFYTASADFTAWAA